MSIRRPNWFDTPSSTTSLPSEVKAAMYKVSSGYRNLRGRRPVFFQRLDRTPSLTATLSVS
jgi:hypothetical protein